MALDTLFYFSPLPNRRLLIRLQTVDLLFPKSKRKVTKTPRHERRISWRFHLRGAPRRLETFERGCSARVPCQTVSNILKTSQSRREWTTGGRSFLSLSKLFVKRVAGGGEGRFPFPPWTEGRVAKQKSVACFLG